MARTDQQAFLDAYLGGGISANRSKVKSAGSTGTAVMNAGANVSLPSLYDFTDDVTQVGMAYVEAAQKQQEAAAKAAQQAAKKAQQAAAKAAQKAQKQAETQAELDAAIASLGSTSRKTPTVPAAKSTSSAQKETAEDKTPGFFQKVGGALSSFGDGASRVASKISDNLDNALAALFPKVNTENAADFSQPGLSLTWQEANAMDAQQVPEWQKAQAEAAAQQAERVAEQAAENEAYRAYSRLNTKDKMDAQAILRTTITFGTEEEKAQAQKELAAVEKALWNDEGYLDLVQKSLDAEPEDSRIQRYLDPSHKLNKLEEKDAKEIAESLLAESKEHYADMFATQEQRDEASMKRYYAQLLISKTSNLQAIGAGVLDAIPFFKEGVDKLSGWANEKIYPGEDLPTAADVFQNAQKQSPIAYGAGNVGGNLALYAAGSAAARSVPVLQKVGQAAASTPVAQTIQKVPVLGHLGTADAITGMVGDTAVDLAFDTLPSLGNDLIAYNRQQEVIDQGLAEGKTLEEMLPLLEEYQGEYLTPGGIAVDTLKGIGTNLAFNLGGEIAPELLKAGGRSLRQAFAPVPSLDDGVEAAAKAVGNTNVPSLDDAAQAAARTVNDAPLPSLENAVQAAQGGADDVVNAWRSGTLTNAQLETLKPGGVNRAAFEQATGMKLPDTSSETRKFLRSIDNQQAQVYDEINNMAQGGALNERTGENAVRGMAEDAERSGAGAGNGDVQGRVPAGGNPVLRQFLTPSENINEAIKRSGATPMELVDTTGNPQFFSFALEQARQTNPNGLMVSGKTVEELSQPGTVTFMSKDGLTGALVTADGDIEAVFKNPRSSARGAGSSLLLNAINNGGTKLDCYGDGLVYLYNRHGFEPVARVPWNPEYAPDGWTYGPKDVYVMKLSNGLSADAVASRLGLSEAEGGFHIWSKAELDELPTMDYDQALAYRDSLIAEEKQSARAAQSGIAEAFGAVSPSLSDGLPESIGAKRAQFERQEVPTRDVANQRDTLSGLDAQHAQDLGPQDNKTHIRYTNAEARADAEANLDIAIAEAGGNVRQGLDNEMRRLRDVGEEWGATDIETAKVVRDRLKQDYVSLEPGTVDYDLAKSRYNNWAREIAAHSSKAGLDLQQFKGEPLSTENVITRMQQYVAKKTEKWAKRHKPRAMQYEAMAKDLEQYADEVMNGTRSGLAVGMDEVKAGIQRIANARNLDVTEEQAARLAADIMTGQRQKAYYDKLLEFAGGFEDIDADVIQRVDELLFEAEKLPPNSRARVDIENQVYSVLADAIAPPAKFADKVSAWRYLAMLFNTRTHGRNNIGNVVMDGVSRIKENLAAKIEEFFLSEGNRTRATLSVGNEQDRALRGGAYQYANDMFYRQLSQNSRFNVEKGIEGGRRIFKTGWLENLRKGNNAALEGSDFRGVVGMLEPFANSEGKMGEFARKMLAAADEKGAAGKWALGGIQNNFANRMASYLKAKGYDASIFSATDAKSLAVLEEAAEVAKDSAFRTTFHEYSALADFLNKARDVNGLGFGADAAIPFTRTPVNIAKQGLRYSPAGLLDTFTRGIYQVKTGRISASEFIDKFATGLTGTGIMALGGFMGYYGLVRGKSSDETSDFDSMTGKQDYALDLGDWGTYTLDWLAPSSMPLLAGAELGRQIREEGKFSFLDFISALPKIGEPVLDTTMLKGLNGILESVRYADREVPFYAVRAIGGELAKNYASQFVPTIAGQVARSIDPMRRQSYGGGDTPFERDAGYFLNSLENKVPGASMMNEAYVDPWGREQENVGGNFFGRLAYNTLSPGFYSAPNMTEVDQQLQTLYDATGVSEILPTNAPKYVKQDGSNVYFDAGQYHDFSVARGEAAYDMVGDLLNNPMFTLLPQGTQAEILPELYTLADHIGASEVLPDYETESKLYQIWQDDPEQVVPYLVGDSYIGQATEMKREDTGEEDARLSNSELYSTIFGIEGMSTEEQARQYMNHASGNTVDKVYDAGGYDLVAKYAKLNALRSSMETQNQANDIYFLDYLGYSRAEKMALFRILWPKAKTNPWA